MADKTLKSLNFGGADNYFPLPLVTAADNDKILSVVNGEWAAAEAPGGGSGQYVWSKHETENGKILEYVIGETEADYPDGGWSDGFWYKLKLAITPYLSFIGNEDFTLKIYDDAFKSWDGTLEYSTDTSTWNTWDGKAISSSGKNLYLRGTGNTKITGPSQNWFVFTGTEALKIACEGNIENLLDYETVSAGGHPTMDGGCYYNMFYGCTSLTTAPELPATTLANNCYRYMFEDCTALVSVPALPATTLANYCYQGIFGGCTSIKLSTTKTGEYQTAYRIPKSGTGSDAIDALNDMFAGTGGTFTGTPEINTTYYLSINNTVV